VNIGAQAELLAAQYLQRQGLSLLQQNYRCRLGEIDLIMQEADTLVFVEVRLRSSSDFGGSAASIDASKQKKLLLTARHYLSSLHRIPACRFDAVLMQSLNEDEIKWVRNAFNG
jgi:putative endonuclease